MHLRQIAKYLIVLFVLSVMSGLWTFASPRSGEKSQPADTTYAQLSAGNTLLAAAFVGAPAKEAEPEGTISISQDVKKVDKKVKPEIVHMVKPVYPPEAKKKGIEGLVRINVVVSTKGDVTETEVLSGPEELRASTVEAVRQWRYKPLGVEFKATIDVNYQLKQHEKSPASKTKSS